MDICNKCGKKLKNNKPHEHTIYCQLCIKFTPIDKEKPLATHFGVKNKFYNNTSGNDLCDKCFEQWKI